MNVVVVGLGYIGLPTSALIALGGHRVYGYDADARVRRSLKTMTGFAAEPSVRRAFEEAIATNRLHVVDRIPEANAYIVCVPTPTREGKPDLQYVEEAARSVARVASPGSILVLESTVPPGTTERIFATALRSEGRSIDDFHVAHCPERVIPGAIIRELRSNPRVVGGRRPEAAALVRDLYASFCVGPIATTTTMVAEFVKVIENTYRDVNIAFANELAILSEELGLDAWEAISLANAHPRVDILSPGPGVGGHCIPVDPHFLSDANPFVTELIQAARRINERMPNRIVRQVSELVGPPNGQKIAILGASYKADIDDGRESPTLRIDALLRDRGYVSAIYDPLVRSFPQPLCDTLRETVEDAHALVLVTPHHVFSRISPGPVGAVMRSRRLIDTRNFFDAAKWQQAGFECYTLGRPTVAGRSLQPA